MNSSALLLHRTAMEYYDLAGIYKAKGDLGTFRAYRKKAWLLSKIAAIQVLTEEEGNFKYQIIRSAGTLGYEEKEYAQAKILLELGLSDNPSDTERAVMNAILTNIKQKSQIQHHDKNNVISGVITSADLEGHLIKIRNKKDQKVHTINVSSQIIKEVVRFYLGELVFVHLDIDQSGTYHLKTITKAA